MLHRTARGAQVLGLDGLIARWSANPGFQRIAFSNPLTRGVARRRAGALFDLCAGFVHAQVLGACVQLDLFAWLSQRSRTAEEVARRCDLPPAAALRLLDAAVALQLLSRRGRRYGVGPVGAPLSAGGGIAAMIGHHGALYRDLADPVEFLRHPERPTALGGFWPYARQADPTALPAPRLRPYSAVMSASQDFIAEDVLDALDVGGAPTWLDLGGGDGAFLAQAALRLPGLRGVLFDLPGVAELAAQRFAAAGLADRVGVCGGDFRRDPPPGRFAVVSLVRILHDHDDEDALRILKTARAALAPGGRLIVAEPLRGRRSDARISDAYFGLYLLAMGQGRLRTPRELAQLCARAGLPGLRERRTRRPFLTRLMTVEVR